jgi:hypothetical protein
VWYTSSFGSLCGMPSLQLGGERVDHRRRITARNDCTGQFHISNNDVIVDKQPTWSVVAGKRRIEGSR